MQRIALIRFLVPAAGILLVGCSAAFNGTYTGNVTTTYSCGSTAPPSRTDDQTYTLSNTKGTVVFDLNGCTGVPATVSGNTATVQSYTCAAGSYGGDSAAATIAGGSLKLNGSSLSVAINGSTTVSGAGGDKQTCDFTVSGTMNETGS